MLQKYVKQETISSDYNVYNQSLLFVIEVYYL